MAEKETTQKLSLDKMVKKVVKDVKKDKIITEKDFTARLIKPYNLQGKAVDQLVQEFEDNGISIVDENGDPSRLALKKQKDVEKAELKDMSFKRSNERSSADVFEGNWTCATSYSRPGNCSCQEN